MKIFQNKNLTLRIQSEVLIYAIQLPTINKYM